MTIEHWAIAISIIAIIISVLSFILNYKVNAATIELSIFEKINHSIERIVDISVAIAPLQSKTNRTKEEKDILKVYTQAFETAVENELNAYEAACALYIDNKLDQKRFKKDYQKSLRDLVTNKEYKESFEGKEIRYECILKVYDKWEKKEG